MGIVEQKVDELMEALGTDNLSNPEFFREKITEAVQLGFRNEIEPQVEVTIDAGPLNYRVAIASLFDLEPGVPRTSASCLEVLDEEGMGPELLIAEWFLLGKPKDVNVTFTFEDEGTEITYDHTDRKWHPRPSG